MAVLTEFYHDFEGLTGELPDRMSRHTVDVIGTSPALEPGQVLGHDGTTYVIHDPNAVDGSEVAVAVLLQRVDSATAVKAVILHHDGKFNTNFIKWISGITGPQITTATAELAIADIRIVLE